MRTFGFTMLAAMIGTGLAGSAQAQSSLEERVSRLERVLLIEGTVDGFSVTRLYRNLFVNPKTTAQQCYNEVVSKGLK